MDNRTAILVILLVSVGVPLWLASAQTSQEVRVRWEVSVTAPPGALLVPGAYPPAPLFTIVDRQQRSSPMPRQRAPELSSEQLLVVAVDAQGHEHERVLVPDPRVLRAEIPGPAGELRGEVLHQASVEFLIPLPRDPAITALRFYHPRWTGSEFVLDLLGTTMLP